jgi:hypothetical protein
MSITIDYFFNADAGAGELAKAINSALGTSLAPMEDSDSFCGELFGMELVFCAARGYVNDRDLDFESYRFVIGNKTWASNLDLLPIQLETLVIVMFVLFQRLGVDQGMLVYEVQRLLGRYEQRDGEWLELISGQGVTFPDHLSEVRRRLDAM